MLRQVSLLQSIIAFHVNSVSNFLYLITSNLWMLLVVVALLWNVFLNLKLTVDDSINEKQVII